VNEPIGFFEEMGCWWDQWLRGIETGVMQGAPVVTYLQPRQGWCEHSCWPSQDTSNMELFFAAEGALAEHPVPEDGSDTLCTDPTVGLAHLAWDRTTPHLIDAHGHLTG
jgi:predicted acyl esterase